MNLKCKVIFNIKIINFLIIHVVIDISENHIWKYEWFFFNELIMNFWIDNITFVT